MSMTIRTHKYAELAHPLVEGMIADISLKDTDKTEYGKQKTLETKYRTLALNFPTMIMQSGLAQAIGFLMAKNNPEHQKLLSHIAKLLNCVNNGEGDASTLHEKVIKSKVTDYQLLTRKALEASSWIKRYSQALLTK